MASKYEVEPLPLPGAPGVPVEEEIKYVGIKRRRKLSKQAQERHREANRSFARRARAQAISDMEVLKAQNALLYLEVSMTRTALYSIGEREFCARVAFDIEQAKGKFLFYSFATFY
jgi:6-phosphogluconolactonase (cycloisomerase 2 family)